MAISWSKIWKFTTKRGVKLAQTGQEHCAFKIENLCTNANGMHEIAYGKEIFQRSIIKYLCEI